MCYGNKGNAHKASSRGSVLRIQVALRQGTQKRQRYATDVVENVYCRSVPARVRELQEKACQGRGQALTLGLARRLFKRDISAHTLRHSFATQAHQKIDGVVGVQHALGHSNVSTTRNLYVNSTWSCEQQ